MNEPREKLRNRQAALRRRREQEAQKQLVAWVDLGIYAAADALRLPEETNSQLVSRLLSVGIAALQTPAPAPAPLLISARDNMPCIAT
jgi:hypothetical protein